MADRNVLVIAYYFPPMGLSGVQRVAKFVKYLPEFGWQPTVLTVQPGGYFAYDETLLHEVEAAGIEIVRTTSVDPTRFFGRNRVVSLPPEPRRQRLAALSQCLFIPDNKAGWAPAAIRAGTRLLKSKHFDAVFSSAPPYTGHLIARHLAAAGRLPLVLDFRDDWLGNPRHLYPTTIHRRLHEYLERRVLGSSAQTLTINEHIAASLERRMPAQALNPSVAVLPQGFDAADFDVAPAERTPGVMRLLHAGVFYDRQSPDVFLSALALLVERRPELRSALEAVFVGLFPDASRRLVQELDLGGIVREAGYLPHREVPSYLRSADVLWMTIGKQRGAEGISTGKLFEYFGARKPILALVPEGTAAAQLRRYEAAVIAEPDDPQVVSHSVEHLVDAWRAGHLPVPDESYVQRFDRKALAGRLAEYLTAVIRQA